MSYIIGFPKNMANKNYPSSYKNIQHLPNKHNLVLTQKTITYIYDMINAKAIHFTMDLAKISTPNKV